MMALFANGIENANANRGLELEFEQTWWVISLLVRDTASPPQPPSR